uniref:Protein FAM53A-like n=1 Tax=Camelus bactrianus TaxID=9837 RepID=A0A9W3GB50_CAMBA|nr:protein FAM53A-like [Camelus bactrianus]
MRRAGRGEGAELPRLLQAAPPPSTLESRHLQGFMEASLHGCGPSGRWPPLTKASLECERTLKNSKSLCSLDYEDEDEDDARVKTAVSSPRDPHGLQPRPAGLSPRASPEWVAAEGEGWSGGDPSDWDSAGEEGAFPLDRSRELDLEQIENN